MTDGTLISSYMDNPDREYDRWEVLPGRREKLATLIRAGQRVAIATNQGGVAFGHVAEEEAVARVVCVLESLPEDKEAAHDAGVGFAWEHRFFS